MPASLHKKIQFWSFPNILTIDLKRFNNRLFYYTDKNDIQKIINDNKISILYIIKGGNKDELTDFTNCKTIIHCVFNTKQTHGDFYC